MNEAPYMLPLLCRAVEDGYGRSCGLMGLIVSKLELEPQMPACERMDKESRKPSLRYGERCGFS